MAHESTVQVALIFTVAVFAAGCCGLRMCAAMLRSTTASDLRREAAMSMLIQANTLPLSTHRRAVVSTLLSECARPHGKSILPGHSAGLTTSKLQPRTDHA